MTRYELGRSIVVNGQQVDVPTYRRINESAESAKEILRLRGLASGLWPFIVLLPTPDIAEAAFRVKHRWLDVFPGPVLRLLASANELKRVAPSEDPLEILQLTNSD